MRDDRRHAAKRQGSAKDRRTEGQRDRDRILYSAAFRRLAGITQTAPGDLEHPVHNRLTHVLEVAQVGRRIAEHLLAAPEQRELAHNLMIDPDVVEAACLAHDLGHPPFGHIAEHELNDLLTKDGVTGGFEGNAQAFRVITKLAEHKDSFQGLDLTRATLNATLKYPWPRGQVNEKKWGYYSSEAEDFAFARSPHEEHTYRPSVEAALMDWADDIAYSVHDILDFYEAGKIPLDRLSRRDELDRFFEGVQEAWRVEKLHVGEDFNTFAQAFERLVESFVELKRPYSGESEQRYYLKELSSLLIERYATTEGIKLRRPADNTTFLEIDKTLMTEVTMLKELTWHYVIRDPALASQQEGQRAIIRSLFSAFENALHDERHWRLFPPRIREIAAAEQVRETGPGQARRYRLAADLIAGMSEEQAQAMYLRLRGISSGSAFAMIIR
jgi:dGTPase